MSLVACPFCDFVTKGAARSDSLRRHVQRKHPGGGDVAFRDNQGYHMVKPTTEIFLKVKEVNGTESYGDAFCIDCYSWIGLNTRHIRQSNRVSRCEEHVCKTKQERRPRTPGAKSEPRIRMDYTDFQKAGLSKYIEFNNATDFDLAKTLANINAELSKPPVEVKPVVKPGETLLDSITRKDKKARLYVESVVKRVEQMNIDTCDDETPDEVTEADIIMTILGDAMSKGSQSAKLDSDNAIEIVQ